MAPDLTGKIALVTAAAQGIGRAAALALAEAGARVIATDINADALAGLAQARGIIEARVLNVLDTAAIAEIGAQSIDILFNCAGVVHSGTLLDCSDDDLGLAWDINVRAMARLCRVVLPGMIERGGGCIINMASVASSVIGVPNRCAYGVTKAAVIGLTKSIATDFVGQGIRCNAICPGTVNTPSLHQRLAANGEYAANHAAFIARQPVGRLGTAEEIADLVVYLAGAGYTTGQIHVIDGGWSMA